jgi:hypothetical protein
MSEQIMTVREMLKQIPTRWRDAEITIGDSIGAAKTVRRVALHRDDTGRKVVVIYEEPIRVKI